MANLDWKNIASVLLFYVALYSFLAGFFALMLKGVMATSTGGHHTLLWTFFVMGISFGVVISLAVYVSQIQEKEKKMDEKRNHSVDLRGVLMEDALQCV